MATIATKSKSRLEFFSGRNAFREDRPYRTPVRPRLGQAGRVARNEISVSKIGTACAPQAVPTSCVLSFADLVAEARQLSEWRAD